MTNLIKYFKRTPSVLVIVLLILSSTFVNTNLGKWNKNNVIEWDITSYYSYLPATFMQKDLSLKFFDANKNYYENNHMYVPLKCPNGNYVIKTSMGMAVMYLPFFTVAHVYAKLFGYSTDGFSEPYECMVQFSGLIYLVIGLFFLRRVLLTYFSEKVTAITLFCVLFGSNMFYFASVHGAMSHVHSFCLICIFIWYSIKWLQKPNFKISLIIGLTVGMLILIRPINILVVLFFVLFGISTLSGFQQRIVLFLKNTKLIIMMMLCGFLCFLPQMLYWKYVTGHYFFNSYVGERFYFGNPHLTEGLFGFRKGWLLYSPIMIFSVIGMFMLFKAKKEFSLLITVLFLIYTYVILSWWCWWYGGSYGLRAMIDIYPFLIIAFAVFINKMISNKIVMGILSILILFNWFQMFQYRHGIIHYDSMTKEAYIDALFRIEKSPDMEKLIKTPDYEKAKRGQE